MKNDYWPKSLAHLSAPYDDGISEEVTIAEISNEPYMGYKGFKEVSTALIPLDELESVLNVLGGIGWEVNSWGPHPCVSEGDTYNTSFWVDGRHGTDERFQTILNSWTVHDRIVMLPDNVLLMAYGLTPRYLQNGVVCWDDPQGPAYDVIRGKTLIHFEMGKANSESLILRMRRDYLEDYCSLKGCAAVAVYYEERYSADDASFEKALAGEAGDSFDLPGRKLGMALLNDEYSTLNPQFSRIWGVRHILTPSKRPVTDAADPELIWPGDTEPMTSRRAAREHIYAYCSDEVLRFYEQKEEFTVYPESGGVAYSGWWGTSRTARIGREHIKVELKKLYEGCPPHVIAQWHKYATPESVATKDRQAHGNQNIATRARSLIDSYLELTTTLEYLSDKLGLGSTQEEIGTLDCDIVSSVGWWNVPELKPLAHVVRLDASLDHFLSRCLCIFKIIEGIKPGPLRNIVLRLGLEKSKIREFKSIKLLGTIAQLSQIALVQDLDLVDDAAQIVNSWNQNTRLPEFDRIFALNGLRQIQAHAIGSDKEDQLDRALNAFGIDVKETRTGWGKSIDTVYDMLIEDLSALALLLSHA